MNTYDKEPGPWNPESGDLPRLWPSDTGILPLEVRKTMIYLLKNPYLSADNTPELWHVLSRHQETIASRFSDFCLEILIDQNARVAYTRNVYADENAGIPKVMQATNLTHYATVALVYLRRLHLQALATGDKALVGKDEIADQMTTYRLDNTLDDKTFTSRINSAIKQLTDHSILLKTATPDRWEISSIVTLILTAEVAKQLEIEYQNIALRTGNGGEASGDAADDEASGAYDGPQPSGGYDGGALEEIAEETDDTVDEEIL